MLEENIKREQMLWLRNKDEERKKKKEKRKVDLKKILEETGLRLDVKHVWRREKRLKQKWHIDLEEKTKEKGKKCY